MDYTKKPEAAEVCLTPQQATALPLLASGALKKDAAEAAGVCAQTVSAWLHQPHFTAALQAQRKQLAGLASERLSKLVGTAATVLEKLLESGSEAVQFRTATYVLDRVALLTAGDTLRAVQPNSDDPRELLASLGVNC